MIGFRESGGHETAVPPNFSPYHLLIACHVGQNHEAATRPQTAWPLHRNQGIRKLSTLPTRVTVDCTSSRGYQVHFSCRSEINGCHCLFFCAIIGWFLSLSPPPTPKSFPLLSSTFFYVSREWVGPHLLHI